jgi:hypothetical protein
MTQLCKILYNIFIVRNGRLLSNKSELEKFKESNFLSELEYTKPISLEIIQKEINLIRPTNYKVLEIIKKTQQQPQLESPAQPQPQPLTLGGYRKHSTRKHSTRTKKTKKNKKNRK